MSLKYTRSKTVTIKTSPLELLDFLQNEPINYLSMMGMTIVETLEDYKEGDKTGEWIVVEKLTIPLVPTTKFKTRFLQKENGCHWTAWASFGVSVESTYIVIDTKKAQRKASADSSTPKDDSGSQMSQLSETATLTCPFFVYPLVRWQFNKNHEKNLAALQQHFQKQ